jgi:hypothetical protein
MLACLSSSDPDCFCKLFFFSLSFFFLHMEPALRSASILKRAFCDDIPVSITAGTGQSAKRHLAKLEVLGLGSIPSAQTITGKIVTRGITGNF